MKLFSGPFFLEIRPDGAAQGAKGKARFTFWGISWQNHNPADAVPYLSMTVHYLASLQP
jgi:hypothetical protein